MGYTKVGTLIVSGFKLYQIDEGINKSTTKLAFFDGGINTISNL